MADAHPLFEVLKKDLLCLNFEPFLALLSICNSYAHFVVLSSLFTNQNQSVMQRSDCGFHCRMQTYLNHC